VPQLVYRLHPTSAGGQGGDFRNRGFAVALCIDNHPLNQLRVGVVWTEAQQGFESSAFSDSAIRSLGQELGPKGVETRLTDAQVTQAVQNLSDKFCDPYFERWRRHDRVTSRNIPNWLGRNRLGRPRNEGYTLAVGYDCQIGPEVPVANGP